MRFILLLAVSLALPMASAASRQASLILSWEQFSALKPEQRIEYVGELREIVVMMEGAQSKFEVADNSSLEEMKEFIASIELMNSLLPAAQAEEKSAVWDCPPDTVFDQEVKACVEVRLYYGKELRDFQDELDCPNGSTAVPASGVNMGKFKCITATNWSKFDHERQKALKAGSVLQYKDAKPNSVLNPGAAVPSTGEQGPTPEKKADQSSPQSPSQCQPPTFNCKAPSKDKEQLIKAFRADKTSKVCIYGGFFSEYQTNEKKKGTCMPVQRFPETGIPKGTCKKVAMCNPVLFCLGTQSKNGVKPGTICVDRGSSATKACAAKYAKFTSANAKNPKMHCDPASILKSAKPLWDQTAKDIDEKYSKWCIGNDEGFKALFCEECEVMSKRLHAMNIKYRKDCSDTTTGTTSPPSEDSSGASSPKDGQQ